MHKGRILVIGSGHLAYRIKNLVEAREYETIYLSGDTFKLEHTEDYTFEAIAEALKRFDLHSFEMIYLVDDRDERNLELLIALIALNQDLHITASLFNENIAPHLRAAHPNVRIVNPAKIAAPTFIDALNLPLKHTLRYTPVKLPEEKMSHRADTLIGILALAFGGLIAAAATYFHFFDGLSWLDAVYFVVVTVATVGYGDINLLSASSLSKVVGIGLILASTFFIWVIFSLTIDRIIKKRVQLSLGRKKYSYKGHVILCGLGRLGYFIAEGLIDRGERVVIVESDENSPTIEHFRNRGADIYIGNARLPRVLADVGASRAKALFSVINNDYANLEIGLNARSFAHDLRLILRIFDESMSKKIKDHLDIHLTYSMTAIADEKFVQLDKPE